MNTDNNIANKDRRRLRNFGIVMAVVLSIIGSVLLWNDNPAGINIIIIAGVFLFCGFAFPVLLYPIEWLWMKLAAALGYIMTRLILIIVYYLVVTSIGLLRQLFSKDPLEIKFNKEAESYWKPVDPKGSKSRPYKPY
jgi:hypothetical protein